MPSHSTENARKSYLGDIFFKAVFVQNYNYWWGVAGLTRCRQRGRTMEHNCQWFISPQGALCRKKGILRQSKRSAQISHVKRWSKSKGLSNHIDKSRHDGYQADRPRYLCSAPCMFIYRCLIWNARSNLLQKWCRIYEDAESNYKKLLPLWHNEKWILANTSRTAWTGQQIWG